MDDTTGVSAPQPTEGLPTSEGVDEGAQRSAAAGTASAPPEETDVLRGGQPELADEQDLESVRHDAEREVIAGPWGASEASAPSLEQSVEEQRARS